METAWMTGFASRRTALFLRENRRGRVLMANSAGIYLELEGKILLLCDESWGTVPNGIGLENFGEAAKLLALRTGDPVSCRGGCLQFPGQWIKIAEKEAPARPWGKSIPEGCRSRALEALRGRTTGLGPLAAVLLEKKPLERENPWCKAALPRLEMLLDGLRRGDAAAVEEAVKSLLGLGPGLTPSADDVFCGLTWGLGHSTWADRDMVKVLMDTLCREAEGRTHPVSAAYLKAIAAGESFARLEGAWCCLTGEGEDCLDGLLAVGSSSGADMLLGLLLAAELLRTEGEMYGGTDRTGTVG